jgi:outer membrane protein assembly factor BamD (BamD/ComL family)
MMGFLKKTCLRLRRMGRMVVVVNVLTGLLFSQQFVTTTAGQGRGEVKSALQYEDMIRPRLIKENISDAGKLYSFATKLLDSGAYGQAAIEYRRFSHYFPHHKLSEEAAYAAAWARFKGGNLDEAAAWFRSVYVSSADDEVKARALYMMAESDYRSGDYKSAIDIYDMVRKNFPASPLSRRADFMKGWSYLRLGLWGEASQHFSSLSRDNPYLSLAEKLSVESLQGETLSRRSPLLAGALSAYLPGAGQLYVGRKRDALVAFLINQGFIVGAVASMFSGNLFLGVTLIAFEVGWYSGNIYSALNGAHKYNRSVRNDFLDIVSMKYGLK